MSIKRWLLASMVLASLPLSGCAYVNDLFHRDSPPARSASTTPAIPSEFSQAIFDSPGAGAFDAMDWDLSITKYTPGPNTRWHWALWSQFEGGPGFYLGLQPDGQIANSPPGKQAVFSFFGNGTRGLTPTCTTDRSVEKRATCRLPYNWTPGTVYRFNVKREPGPTPDTIAWSASVTDRTSGVTTPIGKVAVPAGYGNIRPSTQGWTEWTPGTPVNCAARSSFAVTMSSPTGYVAGKAYQEGVTRGNSTGCVIVFPDGPDTLIMQTRLGNDASMASTAAPAPVTKTTAPAKKTTTTAKKSSKSTKK